MTLVVACRDALRVVSAEEGSAYDETLGPVVEEAGDLSQRLGEIWTDYHLLTWAWNAISGP